jgi:hypothetical protein
MMKLVYADKDDCPEITGSIHPNDLPVGWRKVSAEEFSRSVFFTYSPTHVEYRQMYDKAQANTPMLSAKLFHFWDGTGIAMSSDYWAKEVHYYKFGCDHKYNELSRKESERRGIGHHGMCWHVYECSKCQHIMSTDSSD